MRGPVEKIVLATDGSEDSSLAVRKAAAIARAFYAELHLIHVVPVSRGYSLSGEESAGASLYEEDVQKARELLDAEAWKVRESGWEATESYLEAGEPEAEVISLAGRIEADLIVVGSRGKSAPERPPIGSVSSAIVAHAHCPVLVVRADDAPVRSHSSLEAERAVR